MSERKVLNVSTKESFVTAPVRVYLYSLTIVSYLLGISEILSAGFRSVEDPAHETGAKSPVHRATDGTVQYALQDMRWIYLQGQEI